MKNISLLILLVFSILASTSCRQKTKEQIKTADIDKPVDFEARAKNYLQPMLKTGDSSTNIIAQFGLPVRQYETRTHELCMYFLFADTNQAAASAGVGGFTGFFTNGQLSSWVPIYKN